MSSAFFGKRFFKAHHVRKIVKDLEKQKWEV